MRVMKGLLAAGAMVAAMAASSAVSAATIIDDMGVLNANSSVSGSVTLLGVAGDHSSLKYSFGATGAEGAFVTTVAPSNGVLDLAFEFEVVGQALTLVNADAINPLAASHAIGGASPNIYVTDGLGGPVVLGPSAFSFDALLNSDNAATGAITLAPGDYFEYIVGTAAQGSAKSPAVTKINVGAFAGAAVPEPATWVMMLFGVGSIGAGLRMRRRASLAIA